MSQDYQDEIFNFFAEEKNLENMIKVVSHFDLVRNRLIIDFWAEVKHEFNALDINQNWNAEIDKDVFEKYSKLLIYKNNWKIYKDRPLIAITIEGISEHSYYGVWVNRDYKDQLQTILYNETRRKQIDPYFEKDSDQRWPFWKYLDLDLTDNNELLKLLPEVRKDLAKSFAETVFSLANEWELEIDKLLTNPIQMA